MKYTCFTTKIVKVSETTIDDPQDIKRTLQSLIDKEITCSIQTHSGNVFKNSRIMSVDDDTIKWKTIKDGASLKKSLPIKSVAAIEILYDSEVMTYRKMESTRWTTLDPSSDD